MTRRSEHGSADPCLPRRPADTPNARAITQSESKSLCETFALAAGEQRRSHAPALKAPRIKLINFDHLAERIEVRASI